MPKLLDLGYARVLDISDSPELIARARARHRNRECSEWPQAGWYETLRLPAEAREAMRGGAA